MGTSRRDQILKLIVEDFVETAEPVGSNNLMERHGLKYSSATIRNEMASLEEEGLIEKPHHSAGRVPSALGYRYYLEKLKDSADPYEVDADFKHEFSLILEKKSQTVEDVMEESCQILSEMTNLATVVLGPQAEEDHLASIQVVPLSDQALTAIIVTDQGYVENKTFVIGSELSPSDIQTAVKLLNKRLIGSSIGELGEKLQLLKPLVRDLLGDKTNLIMEAFTEAFVRFAKKRLETFGATKLLELPEYDSDRQKLCDVIRLLDDPEELDKAIGELGDSGVRVVSDGGKDMAIVAQDVSINGRNSGKLAVVGPQRMNYRKVLASLEYVAKTLSQFYGKADKADKEGDDE